MRLIQSLILTSVLFLGFAEASLATPVHFQLDSIEVVGGAATTTETYSQPFPILGTGDLDLETGLGTLFLDDYSVLIDIGANGIDDAWIDYIGIGYTITSVDGLGNLIATGHGSVSCTPLTSPVGGQVCAVAAGDVEGWPPPDGHSGHLSSAIIDLGAQTITVVDASNWDSGGTITAIYSYSEIPEPSAVLLIGIGLSGLAVAGRRA